MVKRKDKNLLLAVLKRSAAGWVKAIQYVNSGQWAKDISKAVHRSGAGKRAQKKAKALVEARKQKPATPTQKPKLNAVEAERVKGINARTRAIKKDAKAIATSPTPNGNQLLQDSIRSSAADAVIKAKANAAKQTTNVSAHSRNGSQGVSAHKRKLTPSERRTAIAKELWGFDPTKEADPTKQQAAELMSSAQPKQLIAKELKENKTPWAKDLNRQKKIHDKIEVHIKEQQENVEVYQFAIDRLNKLRDEGRAEHPDAEFVTAHRRVRELEKIAKRKQSRLDELFQSLSKKPEGIES